MSMNEEFSKNKRMNRNRKERWGKIYAENNDST